MTDFLLELRSEEIPARMQTRAREDLARLFAAEIARAGLAARETVTYATPRRLALIARDLPLATEAVSEELKGPKTSAPPQALEGFLRKTGLARDQLVERDGVLFAVTERPGRATAEVLAEAIPAIVRAFPWPKSMRWGAASASTESPRWVRPLQGIVALFGEEVVPLAIAGIHSGAATLGHRFHHPGVITIGGAHDYVEKLRACHVIVDQDERARAIRERAGALAAAAGLALVEDEGLVAENAGLTEWPVPLLGRFDAAYLDVPPEVIQLTARVNQKYFVCRSPSRLREGLGEGVLAPPVDTGPPPTPPASGRGALANAFVCTANIEATDGGATIVEGNRKVLAARLADARFFYETDLKVPLADQAKKLDRIVFHEKLGTVADKVERVAKLARWLVEEGIVGSGASDLTIPPGEGRGPASGGSQLDPGLRRGGVEDRARLADMAERAAQLCKADLVTGMVGEFPELQGLIGGYYAAAQGEPREVAEAIRDHYKPVGQGDEVPTAPVTVAVSLADKLDTISSFFSADIRPTGSKDPFALRRAALGLIRLITANNLRVSVGRLVYETETKAGLERYARVQDTISKRYGANRRALQLEDETQGRRLEYRDFKDAFNAIFLHKSGLLDFFADRLKVQQREAGVRHDLIDAVFALGSEDDLVRLLVRVRALQAFVGTGDGANLLAGYKRAANILKKEGWEAPAALDRHPGLVPGSTHPRAEAPADGWMPGQAGHDGEERANTPQNSLSYTTEPAEAALVAALDVAVPAAAEAVAREDFAAAMAALATLRAPIDTFFDMVTVNDPDPVRRAGRLALLARVRDAVHEVADFSKIEG